MSAKAWLAAAGLAVAGGSVALALVWGGGGDLPERPESSASGLEMRYYESIDEMVGGATVIAVVEVAGVRAGTVAGGPDDRITHRVIEYDVVDVLKGDPDITSLSVREGYWDANDVGVVLNDMQWSTPGSRALIFLVGPEDGVYSYSNSYGRVDLSAGDGPVPSGSEPLTSAPWATELQSLSSEEALIVRVSQAVEGVKVVEPTDAPSQVADCATLIEGGWSADPAQADDFAYDPESGLLTITGGPTGAVTVDLLRDPRCFELPGVERQLEQIVADAESFVDE